MGFKKEKLCGVAEQEVTYCPLALPPYWVLQNALDVYQPGSQTEFPVFPFEI